MILHKRAALAATGAAILCTFTLTGCMHASSTMPVAGTPATAGDFGWANQTLSASGRATSSSNMSEPQRSLYARQAARTAAISQLKTQLAGLPVTSDTSLGALLEQNNGLRHAIDRSVQKAQDVNAGEIQPGLFEVRVQMPLSIISEILHQNYVTPESIPGGGTHNTSEIPPIS